MNRHLRQCGVVVCIRVLKTRGLGSIPVLCYSPGPVSYVICSSGEDYQRECTLFGNPHTLFVSLQIFTDKLICPVLQRLPNFRTDSNIIHMFCWFLLFFHQVYQSSTEPGRCPRIHIDENDIVKSMSERCFLDGFSGTIEHKKGTLKVRCLADCLACDCDGPDDPPPSYDVVISGDNGDGTDVSHRVIIAVPWDFDPRRHARPGALADELAEKVFNTLIAGGFVLPDGYDGFDCMSGDEEDDSSDEEDETV